jgi:hypothetical protein
VAFDVVHVCGKRDESLTLALLADGLLLELEASEASPAGCAVEVVVGWPRSGDLLVGRAIACGDQCWAALTAAVAEGHSGMTLGLCVLGGRDNGQFRVFVQDQAGVVGPQPFRDLVELVQAFDLQAAPAHLEHNNVAGAEIDGGNGADDWTFRWHGGSGARLPSHPMSALSGESACCLDQAQAGAGCQVGLLSG